VLSEREPTTRERLLEAAIAVLALEGIHALTQTRVAERADLRQSHLTYYFPTRSDLLKGIVEHAAGQGPGMVRGDVTSLPPTLALLKTHLADRLTDGRMARVILALMTATDEDPSLKSWMVEFNQRIRDMYGDALAAMGHRVKPQELAHFYATVVGAVVLHSSEGTEASAREARRLATMALDRLVSTAQRI